MTWLNAYRSRHQSKCYFKAQLPIKSHKKTANPSENVFQDQTTAVPPPSAIYLNLSQLRAALLFPLGIIVCDNTVHQGFFNVWYCAPTHIPHPPFWHNWDNCTFPVRKTTWKLVLMDFGTPILLILILEHTCSHFGQQAPLYVCNIPRDAQRTLRGGLTEVNYKQAWRVIARVCNWAMCQSLCRGCWKVLGICVNT